MSFNTTYAAAMTAVFLILAVIITGCSVSGTATVGYPDREVCFHNPGACR